MSFEQQAAGVQPRRDDFLDEKKLARLCREFENPVGTRAIDVLAWR